MGRVESSLLAQRDDIMGALAEASDFHLASTLPFREWLRRRTHISFNEYCQRRIRGLVVRTSLRRCSVDVNSVLTPSSVHKHCKADGSTLGRSRSCARLAVTARLGERSRSALCSCQPSMQVTYGALHELNTYSGLQRRG